MTLIFQKLKFIQKNTKNILKNKTRIYSLNLIGFYLLICKLTIHFLRPEDTGVQNSRQRLDFVLPNHNPTY